MLLLLNSSSTPMRETQFYLDNEKLLGFREDCCSGSSNQWNATLYASVTSPIVFFIFYFLWWLGTWFTHLHRLYCFIGWEDYFNIPLIDLIIYPRQRRSNSFILFFFLVKRNHVIIKPKQQKFSHETVQDTWNPLNPLIPLQYF